MEKNLYIDASHPDETRIVLKSENHIEEYEYENKNKLYLKNNKTKRNFICFRSYFCLLNALVFFL